MTVAMTWYPDDSTVDDLLHQLSENFLLDEPIAGNRLGDLLAETIRDASRRPLPDLGQAGDRRTIRRDVEEPLTFLYRPHLFPDMDEALKLGHAVQYHLLPRGLPPETPVDAAAVLESYCHLSGDLFGWRGESNGKLTLWLIDVSGHGVRSGFAAVVMKLLLAEMDPGLPLTEIPRQLENRFQAARNPDDSMFLYATGAFVRIADDGGIDYVSAGHQPLLLCREDGTVESLDTTGMPIALIAGNPWEGEKQVSPRATPSCCSRMGWSNCATTSGRSSGRTGWPTCCDVAAQPRRSPTTSCARPRNSTTWNASTTT